MPTFSNISNGESGLSVRNTLNQVIDYVNTGITQDDKYVTGGTYNNSTGTLTLNRQNGSVNVTGFLTGVTETQNLTNVLAIGNTTSGRNIVVTDGDKIVGSNLTLSGGTSFNVDTQTGNIQGTIDIVPTGTTQSIRLKSFNVVNNNIGELKMGTETSTLRMTKASDYTELFVTPIGGNGFYQDNTSSDFIGFVGLNDATYSSGIHSENPTTGEVSRISMTPTNMFKEVTDNTGYTYVDMYYNTLDITSSDGGTNTSNETITPTQISNYVTNGTRNNSIAIDGSVGNIEILSQDGVDYQSSIVTSTDFGSYIQLTSENFTTGEINSHYLSPTEISLSSTDGTNTSTETITPTGITTTSTGSVYISGGTSVELEYYGSPTITSYLLMNNTGTTLHTDDGLNTNQVIQTPLQTQSTITDGNTNNFTEVTHNGFSFNVFVGGPSGYNNELVIDPSSDNRLQSTDGTNTTTISNTPTGVSLSSTDGTSTSTQNIGPTGFDITTTDGLNSVGFVADYSQFNVELYDDNIGTTSSFGLSTSQSEMNATDGTNTSNTIIQPNNITSTSTDGTITSGLDLDPSVSSNGTRFYSDSPSTSSSTGILLAPDQSYQWGGDYNYSQTAYTENFISGTQQYLFQQYGDYISQLVLDPASLNTGTLFKSEDLVVGSSSILSLGYDGQGSFDMVDGTGSGSNFTFTPISLNLSSSNGSSTSTILVEPTSITTNLSDIGDYKVNGNNYDGGSQTGSTEFGIYNGYGWGVYVSDNNGNGATSIDIPYDNSTADILFYPITGKIKFDSGINDLLLECPNIPSYDDDTAASGLTTGQIYQTTGLGASPLDVAGILMVKQ